VGRSPPLYKHEVRGLGLNCIQQPGASAVGTVGKSSVEESAFEGVGMLPMMGAYQREFPASLFEKGLH